MLLLNLMYNIQTRINNPRTCLANELGKLDHLFVVKPARAVLLLSIYIYDVLSALINI
jgi:hypothetical protein